MACYEMGDRATGTIIAALKFWNRTVLLAEGNTLPDEYLAIPGPRPMCAFEVEQLIEELGGDRVPVGMTEYRYANSILWGPTYREADGMHHIYAESDDAAFHAANRCDKYQVGMAFLQKQDADGRWRPLTAAKCPAPLASALAA